MPKSDPNALIWDGFSSLELGMNDGASAMRLSPFQAALLINATTRGDFAEQRPGFRKIMSVLPPDQGFFQHFGDFRTDDQQQFLVAVVGGRFYRIDPIAKTTMEITIPGDANPTILERGWSVQMECFWLYNDGQTRTFIWNGGSARRARNNEIQPGTVIAYVQGRLWYALPDGLGFRATDLVGNRDSGTAAFDYRDAPLHETENDFLNEGGDFRVPADSGEIRAMAATAILDTSQGQGPLQVLCAQNGFSVNTPVDRTVWKDVKYPIQTESLIGSGCAGSEALQNINSDLWYRDPDGGIRSYKIARAEFNTFGNTPQSYEMSGLLNFDQKDLLGFGSSAVFDNRYLTTISPTWSHAGVYHRGLAVVDLSPITAMAQESPPVYDGLWTGLNILAVRKTVEGVYILVLEDDESISLWQLTNDELFDDGDGRIQWSVVPRSLFVERDAAGRPIRQLKRLETADCEYDQIQGSVEFKMSWQPDSYPCPTQWHEWNECVPDCFSTFDCSKPLIFNTGYQPRKRLPEPPDVCAAGATRPLRNFYALNPRLDITGPARLLSVRFGASHQPEPKYEANSCEVAPCIPIQCCGYDPFSYKSQGTSGGYPYGSGSGGSGGGPNPPQPPTPPDIKDQLQGGSGGSPPPPPIIIPPDNPTFYDIPLLNGWSTPFSGLWISNYAITKITDNVVTDGLTAAQNTFWQQLIINEWNDNPSHPSGWTQVQLCWYWVDPYFGDWGDFNAKFATGDPTNPDGLPVYNPGPFWALAILWR